MKLPMLVDIPRTRSDRKEFISLQLFMKLCPISLFLYLAQCKNLRLQIMTKTPKPTKT